MNGIKVFPVGKIKKEENEVKIVIDLEYRDHLKDQIQSHWPKSYEESGNFDWDAEFNF